MPVKRRTPKGRPLVITPEAIAAFRQMETAESDNEWWHWHNQLHRALALRPHEWPAFEYPDAVCPYPKGCHAALHWQARRDERPEAFELYHELKAAAAAAEKG